VVVVVGSLALAVVEGELMHGEGKGMEREGKGL